MKYRVIRIGNNVQEIAPKGNSEEEIQKNVASMAASLPGVDVTLGWFECDCVEKLKTQDTFTKEEVLNMLGCKIRH